MIMSKKEKKSSNTKFWIIWAVVIILIWACVCRYCCKGTPTSNEVPVDDEDAAKLSSEYPVRGASFEDSNIKRSSDGDISSEENNDETNEENDNENNETDLYSNSTIMWAVEAWDLITVDYVWKLLDGTVFDTSIKSVAQEAWVYSEGRDYSAWLEFTAGAGQMIKGFDEAVIWMKVWETKSVELPPEKAYGERSKDNLISASKAEVWEIEGAEVWMQLVLWGYYPAKIAEITDDGYVFDLNHDLAWKTLVFDITIKDIKKTNS